MSAFCLDVFWFPLLCASPLRCRFTPSLRTLTRSAISCALRGTQQAAELAVQCGMNRDCTALYSAAGALLKSSLVKPYFLLPSPASLPFSCALLSFVLAHSCHNLSSNCPMNGLPIPLSCVDYRQVLSADWWKGQAIASGGADSQLRLFTHA